MFIYCFIISELIFGFLDVILIFQRELEVLSFVTLTARLSDSWSALFS